MKLAQLRANADRYRLRWLLARRYGTLGLEIQNALTNSRERVWNCWVRQAHQEKMGSHGRCYRCGKKLR